MKKPGAGWDQSDGAGVKEIEWTEASLEDMAALDRGIARRVKQTVERFAGSGAGNVKDSRASTHPSIAFGSATTASASNWTAAPFAFSVCGTAAKLTAEISGVVT